MENTTSFIFADKNTVRNRIKAVQNMINLIPPKGNFSSGTSYPTIQFGFNNPCTTKNKIVLPIDLIVGEHFDRAKVHALICHELGHQFWTPYFGGNDSTPRILRKFKSMPFYHELDNVIEDIRVDSLSNETMTHSRNLMEYLVLSETANSEREKLIVKVNDLRLVQLTVLAEAYKMIFGFDKLDKVIEIGKTELVRRAVKKGCKKKNYFIKNYDKVIEAVAELITRLKTAQDRHYLYGANFVNVTEKALRELCEFFEKYYFRPQPQQSKGTSQQQQSDSDSDSDSDEKNESKDNSSGSNEEQSEEETEDNSDSEEDKEEHEEETEGKSTEDSSDTDEDDSEEDESEGSSDSDEDEEENEDETEGKSTEDSSDTDEDESEEDESEGSSDSDEEDSDDESEDESEGNTEDDSEDNSEDDSEDNSEDDAEDDSEDDAEDDSEDDAEDDSDEGSDENESLHIDSEDKFEQDEDETEDKNESLDNNSDSESDSEADTSSETDDQEGTSDENQDNQTDTEAEDEDKSEDEGDTESEDEDDSEEPENSEGSQDDYEPNEDPFETAQNIEENMESLDASSQDLLKEVSGQELTRNANFFNETKDGNVVVLDYTTMKEAEKAFVDAKQQQELLKVVQIVKKIKESTTEDLDSYSESYWESIRKAAFAENIGLTGKLKNSLMAYKQKYHSQPAKTGYRLNKRQLHNIARGSMVSHPFAKKEKGIDLSTEILFLTDISGSMTARAYEDAPTTADKVNRTLTVLFEALQKVGSNIKVNLAAYDHSVYPIKMASQPFSNLNRMPAPNGSTDGTGAVAWGVDLLSKSKAHRKILICMTDGEWDGSPATDLNYPVISSLGIETYGVAFIPERYFHNMADREFLARFDKWFCLEDGNIQEFYLKFLNELLKVAPN